MLQRLLRGLAFVLALQQGASAYARLAHGPTINLTTFGGISLYSRMRDQKIQPDWSSTQQSQWRREQHQRIAGA